MIVLHCVSLTGKTSVSIKLAKELNGEVINADVYQAYKGLDIATAKITKEEVNHVECSVVWCSVV